MQPTPYLFFNGNCAEALEAYAEIFGATVEMQMPASELPPEYPVPEDKKDWVLHATLTVGNGQLMASDDVFGTAGAMAGCSVMMSYPTVSEARKIFDRLAEGGEIEMAFEPTFWSKGFGTLKDRFGVSWMIGCDD